MRNTLVSTCTVNCDTLLLVYLPPDFCQYLRDQTCSISQVISTCMYTTHTQKNGGRGKEKGEWSEGEREKRRGGGKEEKRGRKKLVHKMTPHKFL